MEFLYLLRAVKPCLIKIFKDVFCITPMLTALSIGVIQKTSLKILTADSPLLEAILEFFLICFMELFLNFLKTVWFPRKFYFYVLHNTLMVVVLKHSMGGWGGWGGGWSLLGAILSLVFVGEGSTFSIFFSISWESFGLFWYNFAKIFLISYKK